MPSGGGLRSRGVVSSAVALAVVGASVLGPAASLGCGSAPPPRARVARPCVQLAWIDEARGSLAVQYRSLGDDAWLAIDLRDEPSVLYGQDRLAAIGVRRGDRVVLVPAVFGSSMTELDVVTEPERPFAPGFVVGRLGREGLEGRIVEIDTTRMLACDLYEEQVTDVTFRDDAAALAGPFTGRRFVVRVDHGEGRVGSR